MIIQQPRILCLFSAPLVAPDGSPLDALDVEAEREAIIRELTACNQQVLLRIGVATTNELARGVTDAFNILHWSGHGNPEFLLFEDGKGGSHPVTGEFLKKLISTTPFELAIVSACHSEEIAKMLVKAGVRHVVAIRRDYPVLDRAATAFVNQFYRNLFHGDAIQRAFEMAKLLVEGNPDLMKIKPQLEFIAQKKGEHFTPEEEKFILLPSDPQRHLDPLLSETPQGTLQIEESRMSKTNLPKRPQAFTGRSVEMHAIINELLANRMVTVTGGGGIGKTCVAREVARWFHARNFFPDGVFLVDLREVNTAEGIIACLGAALEKKLTEPRDIIAQLQKCQCLLVLDNAEDVLWQEEEGAWEVIETVLKFVPGTKLLITSQRPVGGSLYEPERVSRIFPLNVPYACLLFLRNTKRDISREEWESDAFRLLLNQLGGHPLSIVLMAKQLTHGTTLDDLIERIKKYKEKAISVKGITGRDPEHGESLVATLASAYDNVSEDARTVFGVLSMLPTGAEDFTLKAIYGPDAWERVQELNDASLVEILDRRVVMLPPMRLFAMSVLAEDVKKGYGPRIVALMGSYAQQFYERHRALDAKMYRFFFTLEEPNFRSAIELPFDPPQTDKGGSALGFLTPHLISLYILHDRCKEAKEIGDIAISRIRSMHDALGEAYTLKALGDLAMRTADLRGAKEKYEKALELYRAIDDKLGEANTLQALGDLAMRTDDLRGAKEKYEKALELFHAIDAKLGEANTLKALGDLAMRTDDLRGAKEKYEKALELYRAIDAKLGEANTLMRTGYWYALEGDVVNAETHLDNALTIYKTIEDLEGQADVYMGKALILIKRNDIPSARHALDECSSIRDKVLAHGEAAQWLIFFADHLLERNLSEGAKLCLEYAETYAAKAQDLNLQNQVRERKQNLKE